VAISVDGRRRWLDNVFIERLWRMGAIARTATNVRSGAKTPVAGMIDALTLLAVLLFAAPFARHIPLAVLSAILMVVSYNMGEWGEIQKLLKMSWATVAVWLTTFALTVFADLTVAVQVGIVLAALLFIHKVAKTTTVSRVTKEYVEDGRLQCAAPGQVPKHRPSGRRGVLKRADGCALADAATASRGRSMRPALLRPEQRLPTPQTALD
jgi:MFS superfamily sulfate permease-like transporter